MKKLFLSALYFGTSFLFMTAVAQNTNEWTKNKSKKWFKEKEWLGGLELKPHKTVNVQEFARQYHLNKSYWDKAFAFLKNTDLDKIAKSKKTIFFVKNFFFFIIINF